MEPDHTFRCAICGEVVDCRDLGEVFRHEHDDLDTPRWDGSVRVGDSTFHLRGGGEVPLN